MYRGHSFAWGLAVLVVALLLLCLLVAVVWAVNRQFEALAGRIAALELELELGQPSLTDAWVGGGGGVERFVGCFATLCDFI